MPYIPKPPTHTIFIVLRIPSLMEDGGRYSFMQAYKTDDSAVSWINSQKGEFFGPGSYCIQEVEMENDDVL